MEKTCKIYKISCNVTGDCYIGSTTQSLKKRLSSHKSSCNYVKKCTSYQIINNGNYEIELIVDLGDVSKEERDAKEKYYIENNECINKYIPGRGIGNIERCKSYREANKERLNEKKKEYYEKNKEQIKEKFTCECGGNYSRNHKAKHMKTKKHQKYLDSITI